MPLKNMLKGILTEEQSDNYYNLVNQADYDDDGVEETSFSLVNFKQELDTILGDESKFNLDTLSVELHDLHQRLNAKIYSYDEFEIGVEDSLDDLEKAIVHINKALDILLNIEALNPNTL
jgi:hypothetical protein